MINDGKLILCTHFVKGLMWLLRKEDIEIEYRSILLKCGEVIVGELMEVKLTECNGKFYVLV